MIDSQTALIYTMVITSAADRNMTDRELLTIGTVVRSLPAFIGFEEDRLPKVAQACAKELAIGGNGLDRILQQIKKVLTPRLRETAYAVACDVVAADGSPTQEELRILEMIRHRLQIDRLAAAGIERGARARYQRL